MLCRTVLLLRSLFFIQCITKYWEKMGFFKIFGYEPTCMPSPSSVVRPWSINAICRQKHLLCCCQNDLIHGHFLRVLATSMLQFTNYGSDQNRPGDFVSKFWLICPIRLIDHDTARAWIDHEGDIRGSEIGRYQPTWIYGFIGLRQTGKLPKAKTGKRR